MTRTKKLPIWAKILIITLVILIVAFIVFVSLDISINIPYGNLYSEEEHLARVAERVEKRYIENDYGFTSYTLYPLYDQNEQLRYFLIEFEPHWFVFVRLNIEYSQIIGSLNNMYSRCEYIGGNWQRYRIWQDGIVKNEDGSTEVLPYSDSRWESTDSTKYDGKYFETNGYSRFIYHNRSPYSVANVMSERKYLLTLKNQSATYMVPAIRKGDKWLNLVSLEEFDLSEDIESLGIPEIFVAFNCKAYYNL